MSIAYDIYLKTHKDCVRRAAAWIFDRISTEKLNDIFPKLSIIELDKNLQIHDASKGLPEEYEAYDDYFYGKEKTPEIEEAFNYAWLHHIHNNPHHWQHWILKEDDSMVFGDSMLVKCLDIPDHYILEMIADWWSFSWKKYLTSHDKNDLYEIFSWYELHIDCMLMHENAKQKVENLLDLIHDILDSSPSTIELV